MKKYLNGEVFVKFLQQLNSFWSVKPHHSFCWGKKSVCWKADRSSKEAEKCFATAGDKELWTIEEWKWKPCSSISFIRQTLKEFATNFHLKCIIHWNHHHVLTDKLSYNLNNFSHSFVKNVSGDTWQHVAWHWYYGTWFWVMLCAVCWAEQGARPSENPKSLTNKNGEEEDPSHPAACHEEN